MADNFLPRNYRSKCKLAKMLEIPARSRITARTARHALGIRTVGNGTARRRHADACHKGSSWVRTYSAFGISGQVGFGQLTNPPSFSLPSHSLSESGHCFGLMAF